MERRLNPATTHHFMYGYRAKSVESSETLEYSLLKRTPSKSLFNVIDEFKGLPNNSHVLDLGCGDGILEYHAGQKQHYGFTGIDLEPAAIATLQRIFKQQNNEQDLAIIGDIRNLRAIPLMENRKYDAVVSWRVIHGISPKYYLDIFTQVHDLLKPKSSFFVAVASDKDWKVNALGDTYTPHGINDCSEIMFRNYGIERLVPFPVHFFSQEELVTIGQQSGFTALSTHFFQEPSGYSHLQDHQNTYIFVEFAR